MAVNTVLALFFSSLNLSKYAVSIEDIRLSGTWSKHTTHF